MVSHIVFKSTTEIDVTNLNDLLADFNAERIAEITKAETRQPTPEQTARLNRDIELGIRDTAGNLIIPENNEDEEYEDEEEEEGE